MYTVDRIEHMLNVWSDEKDYKQIEAYIGCITYSIHMNLFDELYRPSENDLDNWLMVLDCTEKIKDKLKNRSVLLQFVCKFEKERNSS